MVNLELYRVFNAVAECGSLTKAAERLFISQPAVSQSIKQLETQLGGQLFLRTSKGMELTSAGALMFDKVKSALDILDNAQNSFEVEVEKVSGSIRICASDTVFTHILSDVIVAFNKKYKDISIFLNNCMTSESIDNLKNNRGDIGFVNLPIDSPDVSFVNTLIELNDIFVAKPNTFLLESEVVDLKSLEDYPLIMLEKSTSTSQAIISFAQTVGAHLHPEIEIGSLELIRELAKKGLGIACVPKEFVKKELVEKSLIEIKTKPILPTRAIGIVLAKDRVMPHSVKLFLQEMSNFICIKRQ